MPPSFLALTLLFLPGAQVASPAPAALIDRLVQNAAQFRATVPSLTADESISSSSTVYIFKRHAEAEGTFRILRPEAQPQNVANGHPPLSEQRLEESRQITRLNGKPVDPGHKVNLPSTLFGGFGRFQEMFFTPAHRLCYTFTLLPEPGAGDSLQIAIAGPTATPLQPGCSAESLNLTGLAVVDRESGQLLHLERTIPDSVSAHTNLAPFASVDCARTRVGDETYWLPTTVIGRILDSRVRGEFIAHYSNYHRYTASIRLLPGAIEVAPAPPPPTSPASTPQ